MNERFTDLTCVVVHHRNFPQVVETVRGLLHQGLDAESVLLVDNSEDQDIVAELYRAMPKGVDVLITENLGYAAAVNAGVAHLLAQDRLRDFTLVATHEVRPSPFAIAQLMAVIRIDRNVSAVGPTLIDLNSQRIWSRGGTRSAVLQIPLHAPPSHGDTGAPLDREWLDGAFVIYRSAELVNRALPEQYFLYFEETHFHQSLRKRGGRVVWVPSAEVGQSTAGVPAYLHGRNLAIFMRAHGRPGLRTVASGWVGIKTLCREALGRVPDGTTRAYVSGWRDRHRPPGALR